MEKIIINGLMYNCKNGTNNKIKNALHKAEKAPSSDHESGIAFNDFNDILWNITDNKIGIYIENVYQTT